MNDTPVVYHIRTPQVGGFSQVDLPIEDVNNLLINVIDPPFYHFVWRFCGNWDTESGSASILAKTKEAALHWFLYKHYNQRRLGWHLSELKLISSTEGVFYFEAAKFEKLIKEFKYHA